MVKIIKINMRNLFYLILGLLIIFIAFYVFTTLSNNYEDCIQECENNNECLRYGEKDGGRLSEPCLEYSNAPCKNICVEKYK